MIAPALPVVMVRPALDWHAFLSWVAIEIEQDRVPEFSPLSPQDRMFVAALLRAAPSPWGAH